MLKRLVIQMLIINKFTVRYIRYQKKNFQSIKETNQIPKYFNCIKSHITKSFVALKWPLRIERSGWSIVVVCLETDCKISNVDNLINGRNNFLHSIRNTSHSGAINPIRVSLDSSFPQQRHDKYASSHKYLQKRKNRYLCPSIFIIQLQIWATRRIWSLDIAYSQLHAKIQDIYLWLVKELVLLDWNIEWIIFLNKLALGYLFW